MWHKTAETTALLDSGATHNFIDKQAISTLNLGMRLLPKPLTVQNVDGTINQEGQIEKYCNLWVCKGNKRNKQCFYVANLGWDHLILGHPWFKGFNPTIDWSRNIVGGDKFHIETTGHQIKKQHLRRTRTIEVDPSIPLHYHQHTQVFDKEAAKWFPPSREEDHVITLKPDTPDTLNCKVYTQTATEEEATRLFINEHLEKGYIEESNSPYTSPFFFQKKKDGKLRPIMDYRVLNSWMLKVTYPLPLINTILEHLQEKTHFYQVWHPMGVQKHLHQERGSMEGSFQNTPRTISTMCHVLWTHQLTSHLLSNHG